MKIWIQKMTPILERNNLEDLLESSEQEPQITANYRGCVDRFLEEGHSKEDIQHWSDHYIDYIGGPVKNPQFVQLDDKEWDKLMKERGQDGMEFSEDAVKEFIAPNDDDYKAVVPPPLPIPLWMVGGVGIFVFTIIGCIIWCIVVLIKKLFFQEKDLTA